MATLLQVRAPLPAIGTLCVLCILAGGCASRAPVLPRGVRLVPALPAPPVAAVREAQEELRIRGLYRGPVDGELSPATRVALATLQRKSGLPVSGFLDPPTAELLGLPPLPTENGGFSPGKEVRAAALPPEPLLPQPPPGTFAPLREELDRELRSAASKAGQLVAAAAKEPLGSAARSLAGAEATLHAARIRAFDRLLRAREQGGFALLPAALLRELEQELGKRAVLARGIDGRLGPDDAEAIRWIERSRGLRETGLPSLRLLEELGIDPAPLLEAP